MRRVELRSPLARAVVPVLGGIGALVVIGLFTWVLAVVITGRSDVEDITVSELPLGSTEARAEDIAENGPILFPGLDTTTGERSLVIHHTGTVDVEGWVVHYAYPADRDESCAVEQQQDEPTTFVDCDGRTIDVTDLARPTRGEHVELRDSRAAAWLMLRPPD